MGEVQDWMKVYVEAPGQDCTRWPWATLPDGRASAWNPRAGRQMAAARVTWELYHGRSFPRGKQARHLCGNGFSGCVNPLHVIPGTAKQNSADRIRHGRQARGEQHGGATITDFTVRIICTRLASGEQVADVAADLGLSKSIVSRVWVGKTWTHVDVPRRDDLTYPCAGCDQRITRGGGGQRRYCTSACYQLARYRGIDLLAQRSR
jgi:hypothetical protein